MKENYNFDEFYLNSQDAKIAERRKARREKLNRDVKVIKAEEMLNTKRRKKYKLEVRRLVFVFAIVAVAVVFVIVSGIKLTDLQVEKKEAEKELESLQQKQEQLEAELLELDSDEYIENAARAELHMIRDYEIMYVVNPDLKTEAAEESDIIKAK